MKDIHITDLNTFTGCRRRWDWQSMLRRGLQKAIVPEPLFTGLAVHKGLEYYHANDCNVYRAVSGASQWIKKRISTIDGHAGPMWDDERNMINKSYRLTMGMLKHYHLWHRGKKLSRKWEVIDTEQLFEVPIPIPRGWARTRFDSMWDVKMGRWVSTKIQLCGRFDGLIRDRDTGDVYLLEFKTSRSIDNVKWVMRGLQGTAYVYAAQQMNPDVKGILYRVLRKKEPSRPRPLSSGGYSQAKNQDTTFRFFKQCLRLEAKITGRDVMELYKENEKILRYLHKQPEKFFLERKISKSPELVNSAMETIYHVGMQMADPNIPIFANPGWSTCQGCPFQDPCDLLELGHDEAAYDLLEAEYAPRTYWEF